MIQKLSLLICCLFTATFLFAQKTPRTSTISINGVVQEAKTKTALEYTTIILKETQTKLISGGITDENGIFNINVPKGNYEISVEYISFKRKKLPTQNLTSDTNFGDIQLSEDASSLDEVVIIAEKSTVDIRLDKRIYNVGKDMTVKGGTASDVLDNVPSVSVDVEEM